MIRWWRSVELKKNPYKVQLPLQVNRLIAFSRKIFNPVPLNFPITTVENDQWFDPTNQQMFQIENV